MPSTTRAQTNIDFAIAIFILLIFFTGTLFVTGSPLLGGDRSQIDYSLDAQRMLVEITEQLRDDNGQLNEQQTNEMMSLSDTDFKSNYLSIQNPDMRANLTVRPTLNDADSRRFYYSPSLFDDYENRTIGDEVPATATSTATKTVLLDERGAQMELKLWIDPDVE